MSIAFDRMATLEVERSRPAYSYGDRPASDTPPPWLAGLFALMILFALGAVIAVVGHALAWAWAWLPVLFHSLGL